MKRRLAFFALAALGVLFLSAATGARINTTKSIPIGLYWTPRAPVEKGAYVLLCPPPGALFETAQARGYLGAGFCPGGYGYLMKRVVAQTGDTVTVSAEGVCVNGTPLPRSAPLEVDPAGRPLPRAPPVCQRLSKTELLVMSDGSPTAFDGRYFGPIPRAQVKAVLKPLLTW